MASCNKDEISVPNYHIEGLWIGTYDIVEAVESTNFGQQGVVQTSALLMIRKKVCLRDGRIEAVGGFFLGSFRLSRTN